MEEKKDSGPNLAATTTSSQKSLLALPTFLSSCRCFLYGDFSPADRRMLTRYIVAYGGEVLDYMGENATHVVTRESWDSNFSQALSENGSLTFVRPEWVFACHQEQQCVSSQPYAITDTLS